MPQTPPPPPSQPRRPIAAPALQLTVELDKFSSFVREYSGLLSLQGMFLKTHRLAPVGSLVAFELKLADGFSICRGSGQVEWVRPVEEGSHRPAGMGLRFRTIDEEGRQLVLRILEEHVKGGGAPFELSQMPPGAISDVELSRQMLLEQDATIVSTRSTPKPAPPTRPAVAAPQAAAPPAAPAPQLVLPLKPIGPVISVKPLASPALHEDFSPPWGKLPELSEEMLEPFSAEPSHRPEPPLRPTAMPRATVVPEPDETWSGSTSLFDDTTVGTEPDATTDFAAFEGALDESFEDGVDFDDDLSRLSFDVVPEPAPELDDSIAELELAALGSEPSPEPAPAQPAPAQPAPVPALKSIAAVPPSPLPELELPQPMSAAEQAMHHPGFRAETSKPAAPLSRSFLDEPEELDLGPVLPRAASAPPIGAVVLPPVIAPAPAPADESAEDGNPPPWMDEHPAASSGRDRLRAWRPHLLTGALVLAVFAAIFAFRGPILELLGMGPEPQTAAGAPAGQRPAPVPSEEPVPGESADVAASTPEQGRPSPPPEPTASRPAPPEARAPAAAEPALAQRVSAGGAVARALERISWQKIEGATVITLVFDGPLGASRFRNMRLDQPSSRQLLIFQGIEQPYAQGQIAVGSPEVARIRTGHHRKPGGDELHVVIDFASAGASVSAVRDLGDRLEVELRRR